MHPFISGGRILDTYKNVDNLKRGNTDRLFTHLPCHEESNYWAFKTFLLHTQHLLGFSRNVQQFM